MERSRFGHTSRPIAAVLLTLLLGFSAFVTSASSADYDPGATYGPAHGWLLIQGGGVLIPEEIERFVALAGGPSAKFVFIPTANSDAQIDLNNMRLSYSRTFGVKNLTLLHTRDRNQANSEAFVEPIKEASAVWFDGGRQWRLADAYLGTAVEREIKALLARGGVVGGGSAGASIQASFLVRGAPSTPQSPEGDNTIVMSPGHETGLGLLENSAIDQHVQARGRVDDLDSVLSAHPGLLGIGIDQSAAIVVHGDYFFVVGGRVAIHDGREHDGLAYYFLEPKTGFDLKTRKLDTPGGHQAGYGWVLKVLSASRLKDETETKGTGTFYWGEGPGPSPKSISFDCNTAVFSMGDNLYAAKVVGENQITITARALNSNQLSDYQCSY